MEKTSVFVLFAIIFCNISLVKLECDGNESELFCSDKNLDAIPKVSVHNKIEFLDMSQNELEELFGVDFAEYAVLTTLYLNENSISYIEDDTFERMPKLQYVDLSENLLEEIPDNIISNNKELTVLDLSQNLFQSETPTLTSESLEVLNLSQCKLSSFLNDSMSNLPSLRVLYLNSNNLVSLDDRIFSLPKLFYYVHIDYNPWDCSCNTVNMIKRLTEKSLFQIKHPIYCVNDQKSHVNIYDKNGPKICNSKLKIEDSKAITSNSIEIGYTEDIGLKDIYLNDHEVQDMPNYEQISIDIRYLEEILKNEKIYFQELSREKDMLDSVTMWTVKIFILVIFLSGIALGVLISALMNRKVQRYRAESLLKTEPI